MGADSGSAVVVGAGPAGAATALLLARAGLRVTLVDRATFPRDKACGGGLTPRGGAALKRLGVDTTGPAFCEVGGLAMVGHDTSAVTAFPATSRFAPQGLVVRRADLDALLVDVAVAAGAELRTGVRVLGPILEDGACRGVRVAAGGGRAELAAEHTIAADGATSVVARGAGLAPPSSSGRGFWYAALRGFFAPVQPATSAGHALLEFYPLRTASGRWLPGYGWVFPLPGGAANVGVDLPHRPSLAGSLALREAYDAFVARLRRERPGFADAEAEAPPVGALLPEGMKGFRPSIPGLLAVGDAAGLVSPYSGEGILYGLESAEMAAAALVASSSPGRGAEAYRRALWDAYGFQFAAALLFMKGVRHPPLARLAAWMGIGNERVLRGAVRVMANLIEDDPSAPASTVSRIYLAVRRTLRLRPPVAWR